MSNTANIPPVQLVRQIDNARLIRGCNKEEIGLFIFFGQPGQWFSLHVSEEDEHVSLQGPEPQDFRQATSLKDVRDWLIAARVAIDKEPRLVPTTDSSPQ